MQFNSFFSQMDPDFVFGASRGIPRGMPRGMPHGIPRGFPGQMARENTNNNELYEILGLDKTATPDDIKKGFRKKAMKEHPDRGGDAEKFKQINEAYEILKDDNKRELYNKHGLDAVKNEENNPFNQMYKKQQEKKTKPINIPIKIDLATLYNGKTVKHKVKIKTYNKNEELSTCMQCNGTKYLRSFRQIGPGMVQQINKPCDKCNETGFTANISVEEKELIIKIDKGMSHQQKIKFKEEGNLVPGFAQGDIIYKIKETEHKTFKRKGNHLIMHKKITLNEALCGLEFYITHLDNRIIKVKTNDIITPNTIKVIEGEGMPKWQEPFKRGNLIVHFDIEFPKEGSITTDYMKILKKILPKKKINKVPHDEQLEMVPYEESMLENEETTEQDIYESDEDSDQDPDMPQGVQCQQS